MATTNLVCHHHLLNSLLTIGCVKQEKSSINVQPKAYSSSSHTPPSPSSNIHFSLCIQDNFWCISPSDDAEPLFIHSEWQREKLAYITLTPSIIVSDDRFYRELSNILGNWYVDFQDHCHALVQNITSQVDKIIEEEYNKGCQILETNIDIKTVINHFCDEMILVELEELSHGMIPACKSSMKLLKKMKVDGKNTNGECMVCLDELVKESDILSMPCSHIFHGECITKWLETSHYCPICRFEMPMEDQS